MMIVGSLRTYAVGLVLLSLIFGLCITAGAQDSEFGSTDPNPAQADTSQTYQSWSGVTVVTKDGWSFPDATISWVPGGETARLRVLRPDGLYKDWDIFEIVMIRNAQGVDITPEVADAIPDFGNEAQAAHWRSTYSEIGEPSSEDPRRKSLGDLAYEGLFSTAFGAGFSYGGPFMGTWYEGIHNGFGIQANLRFAIHKRTYLSILIQHQGLKMDNFTVYSYQYSRYFLVNTDFTLTSAFLLFGTYGDDNNALGGNAYLESGIGVSKNRIEAELLGESDSHSEGRFCFMLRMGYWAPLGEHTRLDFGLSANVKDGVVVYPDELGGVVLTGHVGLMFF